MRKISLLQRITERILGKKFYVCIIGMKGSGQYFVNSTIYRSKEDVARYRDQLQTNESFVFIGSYSFRAHNDFKLTLSNTKAINR